MECPSCGATLRDSAVFCSSCGQRITPRAAGQTVGGGPGDTRQSPPRRGGSSVGRGSTDGESEGAGALGGRPPRARVPQMPGATPTIGTLAERLRRLSRLDTSVFSDARDDPAALTSSLVVAGGAILLMALGGWLWNYFKFGDLPFQNTGRLFLRSVVFGTILGLGLWAAWVWTTAMILTRMYRRQADWLTLLRPLGLAAAPLAVGLLMLIDPLFIALGVGAVAATVLLTYVAVQETTEATAGEAMVATLGGFALWAIALALLGHNSSDLAPGIFFLN